MEKKEITSAIWRMSNEFYAIREELIENGGEITDELQVRLDAMDMTGASLVDNIFQMAASVKADEVAINDEIKRLQALKKSRAAAVEAVKDYMFKYMVANDVNCIEGALCSAKILAGRESVSTVEAEELAPYAKQIEAAQASLPPFIKLKAEVNKTELGKWIKEGKPVKASCIVRNPSIKIG